jgi:glucosamine 6-phosphate synthetase-like amidotransferase/phosphosugar isomerase protein
MCGIAGYSLGTDSRVQRTLAAQALLAAIAERGADAAGYAWRAEGEHRVTVHKQRSGASQLLERIDIPTTATQLLVHVRDYTKGHPTIAANNHPIRHGAVVGIHNGIIVNDEDILASYGFERAEPDMTVDSEAIFALVEHAASRVEALEELRGAMATAWLDERRPDALLLARGVGRPLWVGSAKREVFFASTCAALEIVEHYLSMSLSKHEVEEGTLFTLAHGRVASCERFAPDHEYREEVVLPAVRAPHEGASCLRRLAAIAAAY